MISATASRPRSARGGRGLSVPATVPLLMTRTDGLTGSVRASVVVPVYDIPSHSASNLMIRDANGTELAILTPVLCGSYASGRPRVLYSEVNLSGGDGSVTLTASFTGGRTLSPLATRMYASWEDPTTKLPPISQMQDMAQYGHAPAFCLPNGTEGADWMCYSGAFGPQLPLHRYSEIGFLQQSDIDLFTSEFDFWMRDWWWNGAANPAAITKVVITNTNCTIGPVGTDLSDPSMGYSTVTGWQDANRPPGYTNWRFAIGYVGVSTTTGLNYYGYDRCMLQWFVRTGNPQYFIRGIAVAEGHRYWVKHIVNDNDKTNALALAGPSDLNLDAWQSEGLGWGYLLTGNPDYLALLRQYQTLIDGWQAGANTDLHIGRVDADMGEARPMGRAIDIYNWLVMCEDAANAPAAAAVLEARLGQITEGTAYAKWAANPALYPLEAYTWSMFTQGGSPAAHYIGGVAQPDNFCETVNGVAYNDNDHSGVNEFMQPIVRDAMARSLDMCGGWLSSGIQASVEQTIYANAKRLWEFHLEGNPDSRYQATLDAGHTPAPIGIPSFLNGFGGEGRIFPDDYSLSPDLNMFHLSTYAWLAARRGDTEMAAMAMRLWSWSLAGSRFGQHGGDPSAATNCFGGYQKQARENFCTSQHFLTFARAMPTPGAVSSDTITQITIEQRANYVVGVTTFSVVAGESDSTTLKAQARSFNRLAQSNAGMTVGSSNAGVATATVDPTTGNLAITGVGSGSATLTVHSGAVSATIAVTVSPAPVDLFNDDFSGSSLNAAAWSSTVPGGSTLVVASSEVTLTGVPSMQTKAAAAVDMGAAAYGARFKVDASSGDLFVALANAALSDAFGWRLHGGGAFPAIGTINGTWTEQGVGTTLTLPAWISLAQSGGNLVWAYSEDSTDGINGQWTTLYTHAHTIDLSAALIQLVAAFAATSIDRIRVV